MVSRETSGPPPDLPTWLVERADLLSTYADLLASAGVERGLIGPREVPRLWERHLLNCAVVADPAVNLVPSGCTVGDVGSGAGLPGLVWAIARPDISVVLIEPLLRRTTFLQETVEALGLTSQVVVWRGRAEAGSDTVPSADVVTARAVAPLSKLVGWTVPLLKEGGHLVALKGSSAEQEIEEAAQELRTWHLHDVHAVQVGVGVVDPPTTVVTGRRGAAD